MSLNPLTWQVHWGWITTALFIIVMFRANGTYWLGRLFANSANNGETTPSTRSPFIRRVVDLWNSPSLTRAQGIIARFGAPAVTISFLTVGFQTLVNFAAGASFMPQRRYLPAVTFGCAAWALIYSTIGFVGWELVMWGWSQSPTTTLLVVALLLLLIVLLVRRIRRQVYESPAV